MNGSEAYIRKTGKLRRRRWPGSRLTSKPCESQKGFKERGRRNGF